jgi:3',5'-cyclic AMP phosphodiesterase CpdA/SAM-dependent methyltransferase
MARRVRNGNPAPWKSGDQAVLLHISDLHCGDQFQFPNTTSFAHSIRDVLKEARNGGFPIDLVLCTGDLAERGHDEEFRQATSLLHAIAKEQGVNLSHVLLCPGNHDISWSDVQAYSSQDPGQWKATHFGHYASAFERLAGSYRQHATLLHRIPMLPAHPKQVFTIHYYDKHNIVVFCLNSVMRESDKDLHHYGFVGEDQLTEVSTVLGRMVHDNPALEKAYRVVMVHHPLLAPNDDDGSALRDPFAFKHWLLRNRVGLVLHGHQHYPVCMRHTYAEGSYLTVGAGSLSTRWANRPDVPLSFNIIKIHHGRGLGRTADVRTCEYDKPRQTWTFPKSPTSRTLGIPPIGDEDVDAQRRDLDEVGLTEAWTSLLGDARRMAAGEPVTIHGIEPALVAYRAGLDRASRSVMVTSILHSQFWVRDQSKDNIDANDRMTRRGVECRRIFFLDTSPDRYVDAIVEDAVLRHRRGDRSGVARLRQMSKNLRLLSAQVATKVFQLEDAAHYTEDLNPLRNELAIFDDRRLDTYRVEPSGAVVSVTIRLHDQHSSRHFTLARQFFEEQWNRPDEITMSDYLTLIDTRLQRALERPEHTPAWLIHFALLTGRQDKVLVAEMDHVVSQLEPRRPIGGRWKRHLDVGACTGRYCDAMRSFAIDCVAIDSSKDAVEYLRHWCPDVQVVLADIRAQEELRHLEGGFDLITCMLGTPNNFGLRPTQAWGGRSGLAVALQNVTDLLTPGGLMVMSSWVRDARNDVMSIYPPDERARLVDQAPTRAAIEAALTNAPAQIVSYERRVGDQLDVCLIQRQ